MQQQQASTQDVLLVGYGAGSRRITSAFADRGVRFTVVERDSAAAAEARAQGHAVVIGDASDPATLDSARVDGVELVAITTDRVDEEIVHAVRRQQFAGVILTNLSPGYAELEDPTSRMIDRMSRLLDFSGAVS